MKTLDSYLNIFLLVLSGFIFISLEISTCNQSDAMAERLKYSQALYEIEKENHANDQTRLLNRIKRERRIRSIYVARLDSVRKHEKEVMLKYNKLIAGIVKQAPDTCKEYVKQAVDACNTVIAAKDSTNSILSKTLVQAEKEIETYSLLVESYKAENVTDSLRYENSQNQVKQAKKEARRERRKKIAAVGVAVGIGVLYIVSVVF